MAVKDPYALSTQGYGDSKQILMAIDALSKLEAAGTISASEKQQLDSLRTLTAPAQDTVGRTTAGYRGMGQGASFGGGDELTALLSSLSGGDYDKTLEVSRDRNKLAELNYPEEYGQGKVAGGLSTTALPIGVAGNVARGAKLGAIGTTALSAGEGAALASAPQFLEGEDGFLNRMGNVDPKMALLGAGIGGGVGYLSGVGQVNDKQAFLKWLDDNTPSDQSADIAKGMQFYRPNHAEMADMLDLSRTPTQAEDAYLYIRQKADKMRAAGASRQEILEQTGMLDMPTKGVGGEDAGRTTWAAVDLNDLEALRPSRKTNYGYDIQYVPLAPNLGGQQFGGSAKRIEINSTLTPKQQERTLWHEMSHADQEESAVAGPLVGANFEDTALHRAEIISDLKARIAAEPDKAKAAQLKDSLKKLQGMTSYELYYNNPGEMLARLAEGNAMSQVRLTPSELLNPHINTKPAGVRIEQAIKIALTSETKPYMKAINDSIVSLDGKPINNNDYHRAVPTNLDKAVVTDKDYLQWIRAGKPLGNFQAWMYQGKP